MGAVETLAKGLAASRVLYGLNMLVAPKAGGSVWVGPKEAGRTSTQVLGRALGARDLATGAGALVAMRDGGGAARGWMAAQAVTDATDLVATIARRRELPSGPAAFTIGVAAVSAAIATAYVVAGGRGVVSPSTSPIPGASA